MILQRLNPADHFTLVLDNEIRSSGLAGNFCALVVELDGIPAHDDLRRRCTEFSSRFPLAVARLSQQGRQYAWVAAGEDPVPFHVHTDESGSQAGLQQRLLELVNKRSAALTSAPLELHLLESGERSLLALRWFHPAADAKGIELVLHHLFNDVQLTASRQVAPVDRLQQRWSLWTKFRLAGRAMRNIRRLDRHNSVLPVETRQAAGHLSLKRVRYSTEETTQIMAHARQHAGMTGTTLYLIGCMMRAMEVTGINPAGQAYCVPYAVNLRRRKALSPLFGNQVSFLFAQAERDTVKSREQLFAHLKEQNMAAVQQGLDHAMLPLMQAGSWLSMEKYGRIIRNTPDGRERSSFWFSYTGDMEPEPEAIAGCRVTGMYQLSQVTSPPGLGLLVSRFRGQLTVSYNRIYNQIPSEWLDRLAQAMSAELLDMSEVTL